MKEILQSAAVPLLDRKVCRISLRTSLWLGGGGLGSVRETVVCAWAAYSPPSILPPTPHPSSTLTDREENGWGLAAAENCLSARPRCCPFLRGNFFSPLPGGRLNGALSPWPVQNFPFPRGRKGRGQLLTNSKQGRLSDAGSFPFFQLLETGTDGREGGREKWDGRT